MKIAFEQETNPLVWRALAAADEAASLFHDPLWLEAFPATYREFRPRHLLAYDDAGRLLGGLPGMGARRAGLSQLHSLPYGAYGTPLVAASPTEPPDRVRRELLAAWARAASGMVRAHLVPWFPPTMTAPVDDLPPSWRQPERTHLVDLTRGFEEIWFQRYDKENRTASRKAVRAGVVVAPEEGPAAAEILDGLYRQQAREWTWAWVYRYGLFHEVVERLGNLARVWVARHRERPVFAVLAFYHKSTVLPWVSGASAEARALCAGNLIHKVIIEDACRRGFETYNFGSSGGVPGIEAFKVAFGGTPVDWSSYLRESPLFGRVRALRGRILRLFGKY